MDSKEFVLKYFHEAKKCENSFGIHAIAILAQSALETGWAKSLYGNMFFGIKDTDGINGNEQLLRTTEVSSSNVKQYPNTIKIEPIGNGLFRHYIYDYFRKYDTPYDSFTDHSKFFYQNSRYKNALTVKDNWRSFAIEIAKAGYATEPNYADKLINIGNTIEGILSANSIDFGYSFKEKITTPEIVTETKVVIDTPINEVETISEETSPSPIHSWLYNTIKYIGSSILGIFLGSNALMSSVDFSQFKINNPYMVFGGIALIYFGTNAKDTLLDFILKKVQK